MCEIFGCYFELVDVCFWDTDKLDPCVHSLTEVFESPGPILCTDEILDLHLLEFTTAENEIARSDLVAECFADLRKAEWKLRMETIDDIFKIHKHPLCSLRAQIRRGVIALERAD